MPVNKELVTLFAAYGLDSYIQSTRTLMVLVSGDGKLITWNPAFDLLKQGLPHAKYLRDFLSLASQTIFDLLLSTATHDRLTTQGELDLIQENRPSGYSCHLHPTSNGDVLFLAEPSHAATNLEAISAELQRAKQNLERKEAELHAVLSQAQEVSINDPLTSVLSRRQIMADLQDAVAFSDRYGTLLSILILDIDHFKKINDMYGHTVGDEVLQCLAGGLLRWINPPELVGRLGGEEFLIILPHVTVHSAAEYAHKLCEQVRHLMVEAGNQAFAITISVGIAGHRVNKEDWQTFLRRAEEALMEAKNNGRDQWIVAET